MSTQKRYFYDKLILALLSVLVFLTLALTLSVVLRLGSGQGISDYYIEYRQGPSHSARGDFSPTGDVWAMLNFIWFGVLTLGLCFGLSLRAFRIKREISVVVLSLGVLLVLLALIVSNVLLMHR